MLEQEMVLVMERAHVGWGWRTILSQPDMFRMGHSESVLRSPTALVSVEVTSLGVAMD